MASSGDSEGGGYRSSELRQAGGLDDWRLIDDSLTAWFEAPSLTAGAALVGRVAELVSADDGHSLLPDIDLRASGVRVRIGRAGSVPAGSSGPTSATDLDLARSVSAAAWQLDLAAEPAALHTVRVAFGAADTGAVSTFWRAVLGYDATEAGCLVDPLRRDPAFAFHHDPEARPLRNRGHIDVCRTPDQVEAVKAAVGGEAYGRWQLTLADAEGNEVDLVPGDPLGNGAEGSEVSDWRVLFGAMAFYATDSAEQGSDVVAAAAELADDAGFPLLVDVRADGVTFDSGKDQCEWEDDDHPAGTRFTELAGRIQAAARERELSADPTRLRFVQLDIDAVDVAAVRAFWTAVLGYSHDPRAGLADIYDPRRLNPVLIFQTMDESEVDRRRQRNRMYVELLVPSDQVDARIQAALDAGGRLLGDAAASRRTPAEHRPLADHRTLADPEGNQLQLIAAV